MAISVEKITIPPAILTGCIGIVCNGEIEYTSDLQSRIRKCMTLIGVDGGLNHCKKMNITPDWIVGDFDSVEPSVLEEFRQGKDVTVLPRAKDCTDLEAAIAKSKEISIYAQIIVWGGLGGRIDHTLGNIFLLFRHPARLFLESEQQTLFALSDTSGEIEISHSTHKTMTLYPLNGPARDISIRGNGAVIDVPVIDKTEPLICSFNETCKLNVGSGEVLVILDQRELTKLDNMPLADIEMSFSIEKPLTHLFSYLSHQSLNFKVIKLFSDKESVFNIQPASGEVSFSSKRGQTVSLIPFNGPAMGITTHGLKWELGDETLDRLDKDFVGISNVSMGDSYSVSIRSGELLCIVNEALIDEELVIAEIN